MFQSDPLPERASAMLFDRVERRLEALLPAAAPKDDRRRPGTAPSDIAELSPKRVAPQNIRYYDLKRNWTKKISPHLGDTELNDILTRDFNKYALGRWEQKFREDQLPHEFETFSGFFEHRGSFARYRLYTKHGACHWLVNFTLRLASLVLPSRPWRILTSDLHSTVWDGRKVLVDFNYFLMGIPPDECFDCANDQELAPGAYLEVGFPDPD
jgi:hypothetical protein